MLRRLRAATAALVLPPLLAGGARRSATAPHGGSSGPVFAVVGAREVWLLNRGERPVYSLVLDRELLAAVDWVPCVDAVRCPPLAPGARLALPIGGEQPLSLRRGHEAAVFWWYAVPGERGLEPGPVQSFKIQL